MNPFMTINKETTTKKKESVTQKWLLAPPADPTPKKQSPKKK